MAVGTAVAEGGMGGAVAATCDKEVAAYGDYGAAAATAVAKVEDGSANAGGVPSEETGFVVGETAAEAERFVRVSGGAFVGKRGGVGGGKLPLPPTPRMHPGRADAGRSTSLPRIFACIFWTTGSGGSCNLNPSPQSHLPPLLVP